MTERVVIPGQNHDAEIRRIEESVSELDAAFERGDVPAAAYGRMQARLEGKLETLRAVPVTPDRTEYVATGQTYSERWAQMDWQDRAAFLRWAGVMVHAMRGQDAPSQPWLASGALGGETVPRTSVVPLGSAATAYTSLGTLADHRAVATDQ
jgi:hypothetical protein